MRQAHRATTRRGLIGTLALALLWSTTALAEPPEPPHPAAYELRWEAPPACPTREALIRQIESLLTQPRSGTGTAVVSGTVSTAADGYALELTTDFQGRTDQRELHATTCDELGAATSLLVAVALEPGLSTSPGNAEPAESPAPEEPQVPPPQRETAGENRRVEQAERAPASDGQVTEQRDIPAPQPPPPITRHRTRPSAISKLGLGLEWGALAAATAGVELAIGVAWPRAQILAHGLYLAPHRHRHAGGGGGLHQLGAVGLRGCGVVRVEELGLPLCAGFEAGALRVDSRDLDPARTRHGPWLGPLLSAGVRRHWQRVGVFADVELVGRAVGSATRVGDERVVEQFIVSSRLLAGIELTFP